jgi:hypothetical protein
MFSACGTQSHSYVLYQHDIRHQSASELGVWIYNRVDAISIMGYTTMPRPTSKAQLLEFTRQNYEKLQTELAKLSDAEQVSPDIVGAWAVKDVLAHLTAWQQMALGWYRTGKRGETPVTPAEGYTWRDIPALNQAIYEAHRDEPLAQVTATFAASHIETLAAIEGMTDEELFTPKVYKWTKSTTLGSYMASATSSHYDWATKEIRRGIKRKRKDAES